MKPTVLESLAALRDRFGEQEAGRQVQLLLALAFAKAGLRVGEVRRVEGPDIDVEGWQVEVKTTTGDAFALGDKDLADIEAAPAKGKVAALALLDLGSFRGWRVADARGLRKKSVRRRDLALRRIAPLEEAAAAHFDEIAALWAPLIQEDPRAAAGRMEQCLKGGTWRP